MNEASSVRAAAKATELLTLDDVRAAAARIEGAVVRTPMLRSQTLSEISGADIWLNTPLPPMEASGTSGMKAAVNGGLNLSVLDG